MESAMSEISDLVREKLLDGVSIAEAMASDPALQAKLIKAAASDRCGARSPATS